MGKERDAAWNKNREEVSKTTVLSLQAGPASSESNRCSCVGPRGYAKFLTCEISEFTPCKHVQRTNILYIKFAEKTDDKGLGIRFYVSVSG